MNLRKIILFVVFSFYFSLNNYSQTVIQPSGSGTSADPYLMSSLGNLYWLASENTKGAKWSLGKFFLQTNNIDASDTENWTYTWIPIGGKNSVTPSNGSAEPNQNSDYCFYGTYNGGGYAVDGLVCNNNFSGNSQSGFFGLTSSGSVILNLNITNISITTNSQKTGGLIGYAYRSTIYNCSSTGVIYSTNQTVGGLIGQNGGGTTKNSSSACAVTGLASVAGLAGINQGTVSDCFSTGNVTGNNNSNTGGLLGQASNGNYYRSYTNSPVTTTVSPSEPGGFAGIIRASTAANSFCYWNSDNEPDGYNSSSGSFTFNAIGLTSLELQDINKFDNSWDFEFTWAFGSDGFPTLINLPNTWLGVDTNWNNTANWSFGVLPSANVPNAKEFVSIPSGLNNYPVLTGGVTAYSVIIEAGASLTTNSYTLTNTFLFNKNVETNPPTVTTLSPIDNAVEVALSSNLVITFNEDISKGTGDILIKKASDDSTFETVDVTTGQVTISGAVATINPSANFGIGIEYYVEIPNTVFKDVGNNVYEGISDKTSWSFTSLANTAPWFTSNPVLVIKDNETYGYAITTTDLEDDAVTITATTLPAWLTLNTAGTLLTGDAVNQVGTHIVVLNANDNNGGSTNQSFTIIVSDGTPPTIITQNITLQLDELGSVLTITASDLDNGSLDASGIATITIDIATFDCSNVGDNTVTLTVTDVNGNVSTGTSRVTIDDDVAPTAIAVASYTLQLDEFGSDISITAEDIENGSTDNCEIASISIDKNTFDCANLGENTVTLTVTDVNGNSANAIAIVTVVDDIAPTVIVNDITVELDEDGSATIVAADVDNGSADTCEIASMEIDITTFDCSDVGENNVTLTVTDVNGNSANAIAIVTVVDNIVPTVIVNDITVELDEDGSATIVAADVDNGSADTCEIATLTLDITTFDCSDVGENNVTLTVTDVNGNSANAIAIVTVVDNIAPTVIVNDITVELDEDGSATIVAADVDNGSADTCEIASMEIDITTFDCTNLGPNTVTLTITDVNGNSSTATVVITIEDIVKPTALTQDITVQLDADGLASITAAQIDNGSTDNCSIATMTIDKDAFNCESLGGNTVTLTVTDLSGNSTTATTIITVEDNIAPQVVTKDVVITLDQTGTISVTAEEFIDESYDNCSLSSVRIDRTNFDCANLGDYTITLTVIDSYGNTATETAILTLTGDDIDGDLIADDCDDDIDGDGVDNATDNSPRVSNSGQEDIDRNGIGDVSDQGALEIPEGFSPNGDGNNDEFIIMGLHKYPNNRIQIYNRNGNMVYESNNYQNYWDGISSGKNRRLPAAPYYYVLSVNGGSKIVKGWLYINY